MHADAVLGDSVYRGHMQMQQSGVRRGELQLGSSFTSAYLSRSHIMTCKVKKISTRCTVTDIT